MINSQIKVLLLVGEGDSSRIVYHGLKHHFNIVGIIEENKPSASQLIKRRIQRLGLKKVCGQLAFLAYLKIIKKIVQPRIDEIKANYELNTQDYPKDLFLKIDSVNDANALTHIQKLNPDIIVVNGTRIIHEIILSGTRATFINTHAGITPKYRGVHGGYWALAENDKLHCGVTVHLVDTGIDTGGILYQTQINPTTKDNFLSYPYLQIAAGLPLLRQAIIDIFTGSHQIRHNPHLSSKYYSHPTLLEYLKNYFIRKIK